MRKMTLFYSCFIIYIFSGCLATLDEEGSLHTNVWVIEVPSGVKDAEEIAIKHNFLFRGEVHGFPGYFELEHPTSPKRSSEPHGEIHSRLTIEPKVSYVAQQVAKSRRKRGYVYSPPRDPMYASEWFLHNQGGGITYEGFDLNVEPAWKMGFTGKGVVVTILDDGIEWDHADLKNNYDPKASYDINGKDSNPMPRYDYTNENNHGTRCAGEVAAAKNDICSTGVAYDTSIGGVRMLDGAVTDLVEGSSLGFRQDHIDVYSSSWGPDDDGRTIDGPGPLARKAFLQGIMTGRRGKGTIFVWASGNGGTSHDSCSCDGYVISPYTIAIGSAAEDGSKPWYVEECPAQLAVTPSSGSYKHRKIITTDLRHKCTSSHTGTSAAAPLAAGVIALGLQANPELTWRDVQHIIVLTSKKVHLSASWQTNGAGLDYSHQFGFGMMDASAIVNRAINWVPVPERINCSVHPMVLKSSGTIQLNVEKTCRVTYVEHVVVNMSIAVKGSRGSVQISLTSPHGTRSVLLPRRNRDNKNKDITHWPFMTVASWGEDPKGVWSLKATADSGVSIDVTFVQLTVFGTEGTPAAVQRTSRQCHERCKDHCAGPGPAACDNCAKYRIFQNRECVDTCPSATFESLSVCWPCSEGCSSCDSTKCTTCFDGLTLQSDGTCTCHQHEYKMVEDHKVTCVPCDTTCLTCHGSGPANCSTCVPSLSLVNGSCLNTELTTSNSFNLPSHPIASSLSSHSSLSSISLFSTTPSPSSVPISSSPSKNTANADILLSVSRDSILKSVYTSEMPHGGISTASDQPVEKSAKENSFTIGVVVILVCCFIIGITVAMVIAIIFKVGATKYKRYKPIKEDKAYWDSDEELVYEQ